MIKNISGIILKSVIFTILIFTVLILLMSKTSMIAGIQSLVVLTGSMSPQMPVGSVIFVQKDQFYQIGDAIAFARKGGPTITHRIVNKIDKDGEIYYQTKGDANNSLDNDLINKKDVLGKAIFTLPLLGKLVLFLKTPLGFILMVIVPALVFIGFEVINIKNELHKEIEKKLKQQMNIQA